MHPILPSSSGDGHSGVILGIESSCDETAAAIVRDGADVLSNVIASQIGIHAPYGGVVPELASREHLQNYTAIGDAVNIAQRLQAGAADQIILSAATYAAIAPLIEAHALDQLLVKGKTLPLQVYQLDGLKNAVP